MNLLEIPEIPALWFWLSLYFNVLLLWVYWKEQGSFEEICRSRDYWRNTKEETKRQRDYWQHRLVEELQAKNALVIQVKKWAGRARDAGWAEKVIDSARNLP